MVATEALKKDHRLIEKMLDILQKVAKKLDQGGDVPAESLNNASGFIKIFADNYHHGKEEELLFRAMEERGFPREGGPIGVMLIEHDEGRAYTRALAAAVERYASGDSAAKKDIAENSRNYSNLLSQHIPKEDGILYMMADNILPDSFQEELLKKFEIVEKEKLGEGGWQKYADLVERLARELA
ncbi:MAG: hemerythrin domain-containing protein [Nitrospirae bacterium]|nr:hemerythrin domain-containing protein [Nitrospirota bacterium]